MAAVSPVIDRKTTTINGLAAGASTTYDLLLTVDRATWVRARVFLTSASAGHLTNAPACIVAEAVFRYDGSSSTVTLSTAFSGSTNPQSSNSAGIETANAEAVGVYTGAGPSTNAVWSVSGTNARLTVTNGSGTLAADVTIVVDIVIAGSS